MSDYTDILKLRTRFQQTLTSPLCNLILFTLDNVKIQYLQYAYIYELIKHDRIHLQMGGGPKYDIVTKRFIFNDPEPDTNVIIHETTHAIIDACNPGLDVKRGTHEACAYLAEMMFNIAWLKGPPDLIVPHLTATVADLARRMLVFSTSGKTGVCDDETVQQIKGYLSKTVAINNIEKMTGVTTPYNP